MIEESKIYRKTISSIRGSWREATKTSKAVRKLDKKIKDLKKQIGLTHDKYTRAAYKKRLSELIQARDQLAKNIGLSTITRARKTTSTTQKPQRNAQIIQGGIQAKDGIVPPENYEYFKKIVLGESSKFETFVEELTNGESLDKFFKIWFQDLARNKTIDELEAELLEKTPDEVRRMFVNDLLNKYHVSPEKIKSNPNLAKFVSEKSSEAVSQTSSEKPERSSERLENEEPPEVTRLIELLRELPYEGKAKKKYLEVINRTYAELARITANIGHVKE